MTNPGSTEGREGHRTDGPDATQRAVLCIRLMNLHNAGLAQGAAEDAAILARGDMPADRGYGLSENEIAAAVIMNGLLAENEILIAALREIAAAHVPDQSAASGYSEPDWVRAHVAGLRRIAQMAIAKAEGR